MDIFKDVLKAWGLPGSIYEMLATPFAIGNFVMDWGKYERFLIRLIADLEGRPYKEVEPELLDGPTRGYEDRLTSLRQSVEVQEICAALDELLILHSDLVQRRHDIVHGVWTGHDEDSRPVFKRLRKDTGIEVTRKGFAELNEDRNQIFKANELIVKILVKLGTMTQS